VSQPVSESPSPIIITSSDEKINFVPNTRGVRRALYIIIMEIIFA